MSLSFQIMAAGIAVLVFGVIGILLLMPGEKTKRQRPRKEDQVSSDEMPAKDWQAVSLKLERHIQALRKDIEAYQSKERIRDRDLAIQAEKYAKLQEKLVQERDWQKKEQDDIEKRAKEILALKNDLAKMERDFGAMHADRLRLERELREAKDEFETVNAARRDLELQAAQVSAENENLRKQVKELKWDNDRLSNKKDAENWVPKQDFERLEAELRNKEKDLARLREQSQKEAL